MYDDSMAAMDEQVARFREDYYLLTGAALRKSAYLALFRLVGYRYGLDAVGSTVQLALAEFFRQHASWANAKDHFGRFHGAVIVSLGGILDTIPDTLEGGMFDGHSLCSLMSLSGQCLYTHRYAPSVLEVRIWSRCIGILSQAIGGPSYEALNSFDAVSR